MEHTEPILDIRKAAFGYSSFRGETVLLRDIDLQLNEGELVCLIGRNGSGKSTLLKSMMKLIPLLGGRILLFDKDLKDYSAPEMARLCGFVPTGFVSAGEMTVRELVELGRYPYTNWYGKMTDADIHAVEEALNSVGLSAMADKKITEISDGEKQRGMIARTLSQNTRLILLDEPSAFLDIPNKYDITALLRSLCDKQHSAIFSTHDLNLALQYADKIWLIDDWNIFQGGPEDLIIEGKIEHLFQSEKVSFNMSSGDFRTRVSYRGSFSLEESASAGEVGAWTIKALNRAGYEQASLKRKAGFLLSISRKNDRNVWNLQQDNENLFFYSLYDLTRHLKLSEK